MTPFIPMDVLDRETLQVQVRNHRIDTIYLLVAMLSATGEQHPQKAWQLNMQSLLNVLEVARVENIKKVFWPSSIAVFGSDAPKENCPQHTLLNPSTVYGIQQTRGGTVVQILFRTLRHGYPQSALSGPDQFQNLAWWRDDGLCHKHFLYSAAFGKVPYTCFLGPDTRLPMMYMDDAVRATIELMEAPEKNISVRLSYNIAAMSFTPAELFHEIKLQVPEFEIIYAPDQRQAIADSWPGSIVDSAARERIGNGKPRFCIKKYDGRNVEEYIMKISFAFLLKRKPPDWFGGFSAIGF